MLHSADVDVTVRRWQRFSLDVPITVRVSVELAGERRELSFRGRFKDISENGIGISVMIELRVGSEVEVEFPPVFGREPMSVAGVVRNRREGGTYGIEFQPRTDSEEKVQRMLTTVLSALGVPEQGGFHNRVLEMPTTEAAEAETETVAEEESVIGQQEFEEACESFLVAAEHGE